MKKLVKKNCVVLMWKCDYIVNVIGVFKNRKEALKYQSWLGDKENQDRYYIERTSRYIYTTPYEPNDEVK